ncbi:MAG TPA: CRTAC1 family protein [Pirellulaceae bacterium]|nr:CRTAC1 family protein [Pirellulaceae bacterium]
MAFRCLACFVGLVLFFPLAARAEYPFVFRDVGASAGVLPAAAGIRGHGAGWGDVDGDGWLDLYVATFHNDGSQANLFFRNQNGKFEQDSQPSLKISARGTGVLFADLDNDGDLDLYLGSMPSPAGSRLATKEGHPMLGNQLLRNDGGGKFTNISDANGACPAAFGGRSVTVLDFDGDGLLDILCGEEPVSGYNGSPTKSSRLFRNLGRLQFEDVSQQVGLTAGVPGLGVAAADLTGDGWPDFFLASSGGGNVMFINDGRGKFREAPREVFAWPTAKGDNMVCGVTFCDVNRDALPDMVLGQHFSNPWQQPVANRLYLHQGVKDGLPVFADVTEKVGLVPLPLKAPHVELQDLDNDGWPDLYSSQVKFAGGQPYPLIFKNLGVKGGLPQFREEMLAVNDFPTAEDRAIGRSGTLFDKVLKEKKIIYTAPGPTADFDNDGRLDMFLANWWIEAPSLLLKNETPGGNWLDLQVVGPPGVNRMGIGTRLLIYPAGKLGDAASLLGCREIAAGYGYASGQPAIAHFGLGELASVDIEAILPHGKGKLTRKDVKANQRLTITQ